MQVRGVRPSAVCHRFVKTTEGTDFNYVLEHIRERRVVVVTDGDFDDVDEEHVAAVQGLGARVNSVVTTPGDTEILERLPGRVFVVPALGGE